MISTRLPLSNSITLSETDGTNGPKDFECHATEYKEGKSRLSGSEEVETGRCGGLKVLPGLYV